MVGGHFITTHAICDEDCGISSNKLNCVARVATFNKYPQSEENETTNNAILP